MPLIVMEPNAIPGFTNRRVARESIGRCWGLNRTRAWFPAERREVTGLPVSSGVLRGGSPKHGGPFTVLITGGSRGARTLNRASRESWPVVSHSPEMNSYRSSDRSDRTRGFGARIRQLQAWRARWRRLSAIWRRRLRGRLGGRPFRRRWSERNRGCGLASILVPFPFAADDHQRRTPRRWRDAGAARLVLDDEMTGERLFREV